MVRETTTSVNVDLKTRMIDMKDLYPEQQLTAVFVVLEFISFTSELCLANLEHMFG